MYEYVKICNWDCTGTVTGTVRGLYGDCLAAVVVVAASGINLVRVGTVFAQR